MSKSNVNSFIKINYKFFFFFVSEKIKNKNNINLNTFLIASQKTKTIFLITSKITQLLE